MALGNKGFISDLTYTPNGSLPEARRLPRSGILESRENRISELASGRLIHRSHEAIDPVRCRIWVNHNRDYDALNEEACADLIESFKSQGRQEVPAIVRRVKDNPACDFEVICGARRHWTATWLRAHGRPDFLYVVEIRELTDEEAFRLADLENRQRKDLSDFERAVDYTRAIDLYYDGSQQQMADRLEVTKSWLSRYLEVARLPPEVVGAFGSPHVIGISHAAVLAPRLRDPDVRDAILEEASTLAAAQDRRRVDGEELLGPAKVVSMLQRKSLRITPPKVKTAVEIRNEIGDLCASASRQPSGRLSFELTPSAGKSRPEILSVLKTLLNLLDEAEQPRRRSG